MKDDDYITLRNIQQFYYCAHRFGLMNINCDWDTNYFVVEGDILHENVNKNTIEKRGDDYICKSVKVINKRLKIEGIIDVLQLKKDEKGVFVKGLPNKYSFEIVEYKNSKPKEKDYNFDDALQIFGQKLCVDEMFSTNCKMSIFYGDVRKKYKIDVTQEIKITFNQVLVQIKSSLLNAIIPKIKSEQYCGGCSLKNLCLPVVREKTLTVSEVIKRLNEENS